MTNSRAAATFLGQTVYPVAAFLAVACPHCSAKPGKPCLGVSGRVRTSCHIERAGAARLTNAGINTGKSRKRGVR